MMCQNTTGGATRQNVGAWVAEGNSYEFVCPEDLPAERVEEAVRDAARELLAELRLFDVYRGAPLPAGSRCLAYTLTFRSSERTLGEQDVLPARERIVAALRERLGVGLRA